jgi:hypothetical protein
MKFGKKDWIFVGLMIVVLAVFYAISGKETTHTVPQDADHKRFYDMRDAGAKKKDIDALCKECHDGVKIPYPKDHPEPLRCLFCHKMPKTAP